MMKRFKRWNQEKQTLSPAEIAERKRTNTCFRCGKIGHWARECKLAPDNRYTSSNTSNNSSNTNVTTATPSSFSNQKNQ
jgi:hypothetical protein